MDMNLIMQRINQLMNVGLSNEQLKDYLQKVLIILIDLFRQLAGDEFCLGFLQGAINSIEAGDEPLIKEQKKVHLNG
jgi:hypothetical protein